MCFECKGKELQIKELLRVLNDKGFTSVLGETLKNKREYKRFTLPDMKKLLKNIKNQIKQNSKKNKTLNL